MIMRDERQPRSPLTLDDDSLAGSVAGSLWRRGGRLVIAMLAGRRFTLCV